MFVHRQPYSCIHNEHGLGLTWLQWSGTHDPTVVSQWSKGLGGDAHPMQVPELLEFRCPHLYLSPHLFTRS
jgi:hypothetical protein